MSGRIVCQGCGQRINLPDDYRRNKIQCPECGVITPVNVDGNKPATKGDRRADDTPFDTKGAPSPPSPVRPLPKPEPQPEPDIAALPDVPVERKPAAQPAEETVWTCSNCGEWQLRKPRGKKACCPVCKAPLPAPVKTREKQAATAITNAVPAPVTVEQQDWSDNPDDSKPYHVDLVARMTCKGCGKPMEPQAIVCLHCGHDIRIGSKAKTTYDPIKKRWDAGLARHLRVLGYAFWQCFAIPPMIWGAAHEGHAFYAIGSWLWLSLMAAFLAGTYDRIDLERNSKGKIRLKKTWYFCFVPRTPLEIDLAQYEGIITGQIRDLEFMDYFVLFAGIGFGIIPGIIWYFAIMQRDTCYVALAKDHGHPDLWLYRGWSEARAKEIAATLRTAALPEYAWY
jgi:hypothetical protein